MQCETENGAIVECPTRDHLAACCDIQGLSCMKNFDLDDSLQDTGGASG